MADQSTPVQIGAGLQTAQPVVIVGGGGGGGGGDVTVTNFPATQAVTGTVTATGPLTNAQFIAVTGAATAAAWDGAAASATLIPILKAIHAQLVTIAANTATP